MQYLGSLEDASERAEPYSKETEAMIARLAGDDDAIKQVYDENAKPADTHDSDDEVEGEKGGGDASQFFITDGFDNDKEAVDSVDGGHGGTPHAEETG